MFKYIKKIQRKPEHIRKTIALSITIILFLAVGFLWFFLSTLSIVPKKNTEDRGSVLSPFSNIEDTIGSVFDDMKDKTKDVKGYLDKIASSTDSKIQ